MGLVAEAMFDLGKWSRYLDVLRKELGGDVRLRLPRPATGGGQQTSRLGWGDVKYFSASLLKKGCLFNSSLIRAICKFQHLQTLAGGKHVDELVALALPPVVECGQDDEEKEEVDKDDNGS